VTDHAARVERLRAGMPELELDAVVVSADASIRYLSGFSLARGERATASWSGTLLITADEALICTDGRYTDQAALEAPGFTHVPAGQRRIDDLLPGLLLERGALHVGLEAAAISHADASRIAEAAPGLELIHADRLLAELRIVKEPEEVDAIARAAAVGDAAFTHLLGWVEPGMTEQTVAWELEAWLRTHGAEGLAFDPLVLAGARAAMPHGRPSDAVVEPGNVLLLDFGAQVDGYRSDMTRTLFVGDVPDEVTELHQLVRDAQRAAIAAVRPGALGTDVDAAARDVISAAGHGAAFSHGLGHGIGLETHEDPFLLRFDEPLREGMVFSIEPGIYLSGVTGIRIEDLVVVEGDGARLLTDAPRDPIVL
jgi:Xaa-Pro aminopeptidase